MNSISCGNDYSVLQGANEISLILFSSFNLLYFISF